MSNIWWAIRQSSFGQIWRLIRSGSSARTFNHFVRWRPYHCQWSSRIIGLPLSGGVRCFGFYILRMYVINCTSRHCQLTNGEISPQVKDKTRKSRPFGIADQVDKQMKINICNHCRSPYSLGSYSEMHEHILSASLKRNGFSFLLTFTRFRKQTIFRVLTYS